MGCPVACPLVMVVTCFFQPPAKVGGRLPGSEPGGGIRYEHSYKSITCAFGGTGMASCLPSAALLADFVDSLPLGARGPLDDPSGRGQSRLARTWPAAKVLADTRLGPSSRTATVTMRLRLCSQVAVALPAQSPASSPVMQPSV